MMIVDSQWPKIIVLGTLAILVIFITIIGWIWIIYENYPKYKPLIKMEYDRRMKIWKKRLGVK